MFADPGPRLFGVPPGTDFGTAVVRGLAARLQGAAPEDWASVTLFVNTSRMQRRIRDLLSSGPARLLPRIRLITDLAQDPLGADLPLPVPPLRRRLDLTRLIAPLLDRFPGMAPRSALFDLADSLARLMDEMAGEGVSPARIAALDVTDQSGHWARTQAFLSIVQDWQQAAGAAPDLEARQRLVISQLVARWADTPPAAPVIVAGSTGSRGATALLLQAVARLPQGAVILPGFDFDLPNSVWQGLSDAMTAEAHPQFRFRRLLDALAADPESVPLWDADGTRTSSRNRLISLSLRPAPVTDQWLTEGPGLGDLWDATKGITLVEAPSPRAEAEAIALRMRAAIAENLTVALITPDRMLTRQVAGALDRWGIIADDSAGTPLAQTAPGRLLRQVAVAMGARQTGESLLSLFKHPLTQTGAGERGSHLRWTRELELRLRRVGPAYPGAGVFATMGREAEDGFNVWADWAAALVTDLAAVQTAPLADLVAVHLSLTMRLAAGTGVIGSGVLWDEAAGRAARALCNDLTAQADAGGMTTPIDYAALFTAICQGSEVRDPDRGHPLVKIWGTIEARVQGADIVILGGMNEGTWPESLAPDPWLNRALRLQAGLLLPERRIGLSAHDYTQAVAVPQVWISRAIRSDQAQTVPSRWVNRLSNLLTGLKDTGGPAALAAMRDRGAAWVRAAQGLSVVGQPEPTHRPSPRPPRLARPTTLSVIDLTRLYRDPYAVYAARVLRLRPLDPLMPQSDAMMRGSVYHRVFEVFLTEGVSPDPVAARAHLLAIADQVLAEDCPWPTVQRLWHAKLARAADWFIATEADRHAIATPRHFETKGEIAVPGAGVTLVAKADRIDVTPDGRLIIYDYKTGTPPTVAQQLALDKQLLVEAAMAERGAFAATGPATVASAVYLGLAEGKVVAAPLDQQPPDQVWAELVEVLRQWQSPLRGYTARRAVYKSTLSGDFDVLSRFGEWDVTDPACPEALT